MKPIARGTLCWIKRSDDARMPDGSVVVVLRHLGSDPFWFRGRFALDAYHVRTAAFHQAAVARTSLVPFSDPPAPDYSSWPWPPGQGQRYAGEIRDYPPMPQPGSPGQTWGWRWSS